MLYRMAGLALALLALAGAGKLTAEEAKETKGHNRLAILAEKLGLSDEQKEKIQKIHADFDEKQDPLEHKLWALHRDEHEAMSKVLSEEQRAKVPEVVKGVYRKMWEKVDSKLDLTPEQQKKINTVRDEYGPKFRKLAEDKAEGSKFRKLRHEEFAAVRAELTDEQRAKMPGIMREEFHVWHNPAFREEHMKALTEKLGLSDDEKEKIKKIQEEYSPKMKTLTNELHQLHQEEHKEMDKVFTEEQRTKLQDLRKKIGLGRE